MQVKYAKYDHLITHSWMKMLWEKVSRFGITVTIPDDARGFPREGDEFIMQVILKAGYSNDKFRRLNRVRVSLQALFMSDLLTASGNIISQEVLSP
jgi:hypothetical protein